MALNAFLLAKNGPITKVHSFHALWLPHLTLLSPSIFPKLARPRGPCPFSRQVQHADRDISFRGSCRSNQLPQCHPFYLGTQVADEPKSHSDCIAHNNKPSEPLLQIPKRSPGLSRCLQHGRVNRIKLNHAPISCFSTSIVTKRGIGGLVILYIDYSLLRQRRLT